MFCILDIETVPDERLILDVFTEKIGDTLATCRQRLDAKGEKASGSGGPGFPPLAFHRPVVAVMLVVDDVGKYKVHRVLKNPETIVEAFWALISEGLQARFFDHVVTFNGAGFDMPVMELRAMQLGMCLPQWFRFGAKKWEDPRDRSSNIHIDLFDHVFAYGARPKSGLDVMSKLFWLPGKNGDGGGVEELFKAGAIDKLATYCAHDVLNTYGVLLRFLKANNCEANPWADGPAFQSVGKGLGVDVDVTHYMAAAASLAVAAREKAPF